MSARSWFHSTQDFRTVNFDWESQTIPGEQFITTDKVVDWLGLREVECEQKKNEEKERVCIDITRKY